MVTGKKRRNKKYVGPLTTNFHPLSSRPATLFFLRPPAPPAHLCAVGSEKESQEGPATRQAKRERDVTKRFQSRIPYLSANLA